MRWAWNFVRFLVILLITYIAAKVVAGIVNWLLERKVNLSQLAENLISQTIKNVIMIVGFAIALTALEIDITPILAAIGATGFIIGFALQGTLSNFASGLMILINRPFDEGDVVDAGGRDGNDQRDEPCLHHVPDVRQPDHSRAQQLDLGKRDHQHHRQ